MEWEWGAQVVWEEGGSAGRGCNARFVCGSVYIVQVHQVWEGVDAGSHGALHRTRAPKHASMPPCAHAPMQIPMSSSAGGSAGSSSTPAPAVDRIALSTSDRNLVCACVRVHLPMTVAACACVRMCARITSWHLTRVVGNAVLRLARVMAVRPGARATE